MEGNGVMEFDKKAANDFAAKFGCAYPKREPCRWLKDGVCQNGKSSFRDVKPLNGCNVCGAWESKNEN